MTPMDPSLGYECHIQNQNFQGSSTCPSGIPNNVCQMQTVPNSDLTHNSPNISPNNRLKPNSLLAQLGLPCQTNTEYDYTECYSFYANGCYNTCQFVDPCDIEDFMNNEKRKEKSRDAARSRRSRETEIFNEMMACLPVQPGQGVLDKASIMRLAISFIKIKQMAKLMPKMPEDETKFGMSIAESIYLRALEGFLMSLSTEGDIVFLTDNVSDFLGITQTDLMGQNIYEFSHPCDHDELREILSSKSPELLTTPRDFFIRLKCTLTSKGRAVNIKSATYKVIHCSGRMLVDKKSNDNEKDNKEMYFAIVAQPIPHPSNIEVPLPRQTFMTKHSLDMKFTHADDDIMTDILGYKSEDLIGKSVFEFHHAIDTDALATAFKCLFSKGQVQTNLYRFLAKEGGYVWVITQATMIYDKMAKPQSVVCVNHVISGVECKNEIYSDVQSKLVTAECNNNNSKDNTISSGSNLVPEIIVEDIQVESPPPLIRAQNPEIEPFVPISAASPRPPSRPLTATAKIFAPRTEEMNKGFLTFSDDEPGLTMLKDEPDDLTHLAPVAGDVCVPLDDHPFLTDDVLDDFLLRENFGPLLTDEPTDPFMAYRDSYSPSPQLLSPNLSKNSDCSLPSLNSPGESLGDEDQMSTFINLNMDDESDSSIKSTYMPLSMDNELPLLMSNDLMWSSADRNNARNLPDNSSSLAQLLCSSINKQSIKSNDGGGLGHTDQIMNDIYEKANSEWDSRKSPHLISDRLDCKTNMNSKRPNNMTYNSGPPNKRYRQETREKMSPELLHQLISNNNHRQNPKGKSNWLFDSGGQKAACISQPSDSVLMNLLVSGFDIRAGYICLAPTKSKR